MSFILIFQDFFYVLRRQYFLFSSCFRLSIEPRSAGGSKCCPLTEKKGRALGPAEIFSFFYEYKAVILLGRTHSLSNSAFDLTCIAIAGTW